MERISGTIAVANYTFRMRRIWQGLKPINRNDESVSLESLLEHETDNRNRILYRSGFRKVQLGDPALQFVWQSLIVLGALFISMALCIMSHAEAPSVLLKILAAAIALMSGYIARDAWSKLKQALIIADKLGIYEAAAFYAAEKLASEDEVPKNTVGMAVTIQSTGAFGTVHCIFNFDNEPDPHSTAGNE